MFKKNLKTDETISEDKQDKKIIRKKKRRKTLKFLLCLIIIWGVINTGITLIFSRMIPHHCASAKEGVDKMLSNTEYYDNLTQNDLDFRMRKTGATKDEFIKASKESVSDFYFFEKWYLNSRLARMALHMKLKGYKLPELEEIVFIKANM